MFDKSLKKYLQLKYPLDSIPIKEIKNLEKKFWVILVFMFIAGFGIGFTLLTAHVNVTYFFFLFIALPFVLSLFAFAYSITSLFSNKLSDKSSFIKEITQFVFKPSSAIPHDLYKSLIFIKLQQASLALLFGTLLALFMTLLSKYISFGWESTILDASYIQTIVKMIALPWSSYYPTAVPSIEIIEGSNYTNHLIESQTIDSTLISQSWYKFLTLALLIYGVIPRLILLGLAYAIYYKVLRKNIVVSTQNITTTTASEQESSYTSDTEQRGNLHLFDNHEKLVFDYLIGWSYNQKELLQVIQNKKLTASNIKLAGGNISIAEENQLVESLFGTLIMLVPSWEPPRKDFLNFVKAILKNEINFLVIYPIGEVRKEFVPEAKNILIWESKIKTINSSKIRFYHE